ncbi:MAG TPA: DMT family transporter [Anaerovoracaceae bacterium]|nr:DMT family transporter [Anaerovoracaceae bacterium]
MKNKIKLALEVFVVGMVWGTSFVSTTALLKEINIIQYLALRWGVAGLACLFFVAIGIFKVSYKGKNKMAIIVLMVLQPCLYAALETIGLDMTTASEASIILALLPITIALISAIFLKDKINKNIVIAAIICISGVLLTVLFEDNFKISGRIVGYIILYLCVLCGAAYTIIGNRVGKEFNPLEIVVAISAGGGIFFTAVSMFNDNYVDGAIIVFTDFKLLTLIIYLGVFCSVLCFYLYNDINNKLVPSMTSLFVENMVTLIGVISGVVINNDSISVYKVMGVLLLISGIAYLSLSQNQDNLESKKGI